MQYNIRFLLQFVIAIYLFFPYLVFANFGDSCIAIPGIIDNHLRDSTAYGHLIGHIDMTTHIDNACDINDDQFHFCLKNPAGSDPVCNHIIMNLDDTVSLSSVTNNPDLLQNIQLQNIQLTVAALEDLMCLQMPTSRGPASLACKRMSPVIGSAVARSQCNNIGMSCYGGNAYSQSLFNFSGVAFSCVKETLEKNFYADYNRNCSVVSSQNLNQSGLWDAFFDMEVQTIEASLNLYNLNPFVTFQGALKTAVFAALIIYTIIYGFKMATDTSYINIEKSSMFVIKMILVMYFTIGLQGVSGTSKNGMVDDVLPFLESALPEFAYLIFKSSAAKGLCVFDSSKYKSNAGIYALGDMIDCHIAYYLGLQLFNASNSPHDDLSISMSIFVVIFGFLIGANYVLVLCMVAFAIVFISIILHFISLYLVCLITLYLMAYLSVIFIPMVLFERTKGYFNSWLKITLSCVLQPGLQLAFVVILISIYDAAIYKNCEFHRYDHDVGCKKFSTFELTVPQFNGAECKNSAGYKISQYYNGNGWDTINVILFPIHYIVDFLSLLPEMMFIFIITVIFYFFSKSVGQFVADVTNGPIMDAVVISPTKLIDAAMRGASYLNNARDQSSKTQSSATYTNSDNDNSGNTDGNSSAGRDQMSNSSNESSGSDKISS